MIYEITTYDSEEFKLYIKLVNGDYVSINGTYQVRIPPDVVDEKMLKKKDRKFHYISATFDTLEDYLEGNGCNR